MVKNTGYKLTFLEVFNVMRTFFNIKYDETECEDLNIIVSSFRLWFDEFNEKGDPSTRDPAAWEDWIDAIEKTMKDMNITKDYRKLIYDEELAFLCVKNYLFLFFSMFHYEGVGRILKKVEESKHVDSDPIWNDWLRAINHVKNGTYELDISYDPFTGERRN